MDSVNWLLLEVLDGENDGVTPLGRPEMDNLAAPGNPLDAAPPGVSGDELARTLDHVVGLVEHGLFIKMTTEIHVASVSGVRVLKV
jgi:hypothetical protein